MGLDGLDPPGRGSEHEGLPHTALEDELLVELAEPRALIAQIDGVLAGIRDRPAAGDREPGTAGQGVQAVVDPVPAHPGPEVAEGLGGEPSRDHSQHAVEGGRGQAGVRISAAD